MVTRPLLIAAALITTTAQAEIPVLPRAVQPNYEVDRDAWIPASHDDLMTKIATYQVRNKEVVPESICKGADRSWEECSTATLSHFRYHCLDLKIPLYCKAYTELDTRLKTEASVEKVSKTPTL
ncbi:hypothetical protein D9M68_906970 [compost metagenome]